MNGSYEFSCCVVIPTIRIGSYKTNKKCRNDTRVGLYDEDERIKMNGRVLLYDSSMKWGMIVVIEMIHLFL